MLSPNIWNSLSRQSQLDMFSKLTKNYDRYSTYEDKFKIPPVAPGYVGRLYTNEPFPHVIVSDSTVSISYDNIYNGSCIEDQLEMNWNGYISQLYDGQLHLYAYNIDKASITGINKDEDFEFKGIKLIRGSWPGFLCLYENKYDDV